MGNGLIHGLIAVLVIALFVLYLRAGKRRTSYQLSEKWTHAPILWAATDEVVPGGDHGHHSEGHHSEGRHGGVSVGGGASGHW